MFTTVYPTTRQVNLANEEDAIKRSGKRSGKQSEAQPLGDRRWLTLGTNQEGWSGMSGAVWAPAPRQAKLHLRAPFVYRTGLPGRGKRGSPAPGGPRGAGAPAAAPLR